MKRIGLLLLLLVLVPAAHAQSYSAQLTGGAEVPGPGDTDGTGFAVVTVSGTTLTYVVWFQDIGAPTAAGIHLGVAGASGGVVVPFTVSTLSSGSTTITQQLADEINTNPAGYYVNVQNAEFANGAIRGQLTRGDGEGLRTAYLPVIGKVKGAAGTNFVTDLSILNDGGAVANVTIDFYAQNPAGQTAPTTTRSLQVAPGEQKVLVDVMLGTLEIESGLGAVRMTSDQNVVVNGRVINDLRSEAKGTAGFAFEAQESGQLRGSMSFLAQDADFRTNIGYFNPSSAPVTATFVARRTSDGAVLGSNSVTIPGYSMVQQAAFVLIASVPEAQRVQSSFYVSWTSEAPLFVYAAVTDNTTGDAVLDR